MAFNRSWLIEPATPEAGLVQVTVNVSWVNSRGTTRTARVQILKADL